MLQEIEWCRGGEGSFYAAAAYWKTNCAFEKGMLRRFICCWKQKQTTVAIVVVRHATRKQHHGKYDLHISEGEGKFKDVASIVCKVWRDTELIQSSHNGD